MNTRTAQASAGVCGVGCYAPSLLSGTQAPEMQNQPVINLAKQCETPIRCTYCFETTVMHVVAKYIG